MKPAYTFATLFALVLVSTGSGGQSEIDPVSMQLIEDKFVSSIAASWDSYSVCVYKDRTEKGSYLKHLFQDEKFPHRATIKSRHLVLQREADSSRRDLSIYEISFDAEEEATNAFSELTGRRTGTIPDNKVLTKYAVRLQDENVYVIRTQRLFDADVASFFELFAR